MAGPTIPSLPIPDFSPTDSQPPAQPFDPNPVSNPQPAPGVPVPPAAPKPTGPPSSSTSGGPTPTVVRNSTVKSKLLRPALTSHYVCRFQPPPKVSAFLKQGEGLFPGSDYSIRANQDLIELSCSEASLPGASLMTNEIIDDYTGVTERPAYRRQYDDRIDFTFYVDRRYGIINFFERWISYCAGENDVDKLDDRNYFYRVNFPNDYQTDELFITKFERDVNSGPALEYKFIRAYPLSIASIPVSYDSSELLKCTVSFSYTRYVRKVTTVEKPKEPALPIPPGVPTPPITTPEGDQTNIPLPPTTTDGRPVPQLPINPGSGGPIIA